IPEVVIMGAFCIVTVIIAMNGVKVLDRVRMSERNMLVVGVPILVTLAASTMPAGIKESFPTLVQYLVEGGMAVGALAAVVLNVLLPRDQEPGRGRGVQVDGGEPSPGADRRRWTNSSDHADQNRDVPVPDVRGKTIRGRFAHAPQQGVVQTWDDVLVTVGADGILTDRIVPEDPRFSDVLAQA